MIHEHYLVEGNGIIQYFRFNALFGERCHILWQWFYQGTVGEHKQYANFFVNATVGGIGSQFVYMRRKF